MFSRGLDATLRKTLYLRHHVITKNDLGELPGLTRESCGDGVMEGLEECD